MCGLSLVPALEGQGAPQSFSVSPGPNSPPPSPQIEAGKANSPQTSPHKATALDTMTSTPACLPPTWNPVTRPTLVVSDSQHELPTPPFSWYKSLPPAPTVPKSALVSTHVHPGPTAPTDDQCYLLSPLSHWDRLHFLYLPLK